MRFSDFTRLDLERPGNVVVFVCADDLLVDESRSVFARLFGGEWAFERLTAREFEALDAGSLVEAALSPPLFGASRALLVSGTGKVTRKTASSLEEIAGLDQSSLKIVWVVSSRRGVPRGMGKLTSIEIDAVRAGDAAGWLRQRYRVKPEVAQYLVDTLGTELRPLAQEVEKLGAYVGEDRPIETRDVDLLTLRSERFSAFDLDDAVMAGDYRKAVRVAGAMVEEGMEPLVALARIARVWRQLFVGQALISDQSPRAAAAAAGLPPWKAAAFASACTRVGRATLVRGFRELVEADRTFKSASTDKALVLDLLLWRLLRSRPTP